MDQFSKSLLDDICNHFPGLESKHGQASDLLELDIASTNNSNIGGLVIQTTADKDIWIRNYHGYSAYHVDTAKELIKIMEGIFADDVLWVIGFDKNKWVGTTLLKKGADIETEKGITYNILSWSGESDRILKAD